MEGYRTKKVVKAFLFNKEKRVLLYLRDDNPKIVYPGYWDLIGGCVARHIRNIGFIEDPYEKTHELFHIELFVGEIDIPLEKINLGEGQRANFFKIEEMDNMKFCKHYKSFIKKNKLIFSSA